jgi:hypothetical protein
LVESYRDVDPEKYAKLLTKSSSVAEYYKDIEDKEKELRDARIKDIEAIRSTYFANNAIDILDKQAYSKALFESYMKQGDADNSIKYGSQLSDYINQTGYGLDTQRESTLINDRLTLKYGDKVTTQEVSDTKTQAKIDVLITKIEALEHRLEVNDRNMADRA